MDLWYLRFYVIRRKFIPLTSFLLLSGWILKSFSCCWPTLLRFGLFLFSQQTVIFLFNRTINYLTHINKIIKIIFEWLSWLSLFWQSFFVRSVTIRRWVSFLWYNGIILHFGRNWTSICIFFCSSSCLSWKDQGL